MNSEKQSVKKGIERLARVYFWPNDPTITDMDKYEFKALSEFVIFNVFVKNTFFTILHAGLRNQTANLYRHLLSSLKEDTPMLTFKEAFLLFRLIGKKQTRSILDTISCPPSTYNGIIESIENLEYELFVLSFENYDNRQMFQVLWQMRYILYGTNYAWEHSEPTEQLSSSRFNEWSRSEDNYLSYFCEIPEKYEDNFVRQKVLSIVGFEDSSKKKIRIRRPKDSPFVEDVVDEYINYSEKESGISLFYSQWKDLLAEFNDNSDLPVRNNRVNTSSIEHFARLILSHNVILDKDYFMEKYGIDSSEVDNQFGNLEVYMYESEDYKDLGRYILYYTWEMLYIYNKVETVLLIETKEVLNNLLSGLFYSKLLKTKIDSNDNATDIYMSKEPLEGCSTLDEETQSLGSIVMNDWQKMVDKYKKVKTFTICKLNDEEIEKLTKGLVEEEFIEKNTNPKRLAHILSGADYDGGLPIIWIKKEENNGFPSKRTVLNFMRLLGVEWKDLTPKRLNCCFICSSEIKFVPFASNNIRDNRKNNASSEYNVKLKSIIETALGKGHAISVRMANIPLIE